MAHGWSFSSEEWFSELPLDSQPLNAATPPLNFPRLRKRARSENRYQTRTDVAAIST